VSEHDDPPSESSTRQIPAGAGRRLEDKVTGRPIATSWWRGRTRGGGQLCQFNTTRLEPRSIHRPPVLSRTRRTRGPGEGFVRMAAMGKIDFDDLIGEQDYSGQEAYPPD
jgi:hypothetical protein